MSEPEDAAVQPVGDPVRRENTPLELVRSPARVVPKPGLRLARSVGGPAVLLRFAALLGPGVAAMVLLPVAKSAPLVGLSLVFSVIAALLARERRFAAPVRRLAAWQRDLPFPVDPGALTELTRVGASRAVNVTMRVAFEGNCPDEGRIRALERSHHAGGATATVDGPILVLRYVDELDADGLWTRVIVDRLLVPLHAEHPIAFVDLSWER